MAPPQNALRAGILKTIGRGQRGPSGLNPYAAVFVPTWESRPKPHCRAQGSASAPADKIPLTDLPEEVLAAIVERVIDPVDVVSCALVCKRLHGVTKHAPLHLSFACEPGTPWQHSRNSDSASVRRMLAGLSSSFKGVCDLDLRGCPVEDADVAALLQTLPQLRVLHLSGCKKLSSTITRVLRGCRPPPATAAADQPPSDAAGHEAAVHKADVRLRGVSLQRCFQLNAEALSDVLQAPPHLHSALLSHLRLADWSLAAPEPHAYSASSAAGRPITRQAWPAQLPASGLRLLALHNCEGLRPLALQVIAQCCPRLQLLLLGGSSLGGSPALAAPASEGSLRTAATACVAQLLPQLCQPGPGTARNAAVGVELVVAAVQLQGLRVLELTFLPPGLAAVVEATLADPMVASRGGGLAATRVQVWDLCKRRSLRQACALRQSALLPPQELSMALQAAVNCSAISRHTPLHIAAEEGEMRKVEALLKLGAAVDARDRSAATPLFTACLAGHAAVVRLLLEHDANPRLKNAAGEAPLYIASLRGHLRVVEVLLTHCQLQGISWQEPSLYGDSWTPLHAAAVADRRSVALRLLQAAGPAQSRLVAATNRYGQTALHIAARRGCMPMLRTLLEAGAAAAVAAPDGAGDTPIQIAERFKHPQVVAVLTSAAAWQEQQQHWHPTQCFAQRGCRV